MASAPDLAHLAAIVESSDDAIFSQGPDGCITAWNRSAERIYGYAADEAIGREPAILLKADAVGASLFERAMAGERIHHAETEHCRRDGLPIRVSVSIAPIVGDDGAVTGTAAVVRDVSEASHAQATLAMTEERLNEGEALSHVGSWSYDVATGTMQWSAELHRITAVEPIDFGGTIEDHLAVVHERDRAEVSAAIAAAARGAGPFELTHRLCRTDGDERYVFLRGAAVTGSDGQVVGVRGIAQDVTEQRRATDAIRAAYERERAAAEDLRVAAAMKDDFLSIVSHELRTPLTSIVGFAALLDRTSGDEQADIARRISTNAAEMRRMIERLLDYSRLQSGAIHLEVASLALRDEIESRVQDLGDVLADHVVRVNVDSTVRVAADRDALAHVLVNLLTNAAKFSPPGSAIDIDARDKGSDVVVLIRDEGPGVAPEARERIFEQFFQAAPPRAGQRGAGVGLSIVRKYVELLGGRAWCESVPGSGSTFLFTLPAGAR